MRLRIFFLIGLLLVAACSKKLTTVEAEQSYASGVRYWKGQGVAKNLKKAVGYFQDAAEAGNVDAAIALGYAYQKGEGVKQNPEEGMKWFLQAAESGNIDAEYNVGIAYMRGQGIEENKREAAKWFARAALKRDGGAAYNLGVMNAKGEGLKQNLPLAAAWFSLAIAAGREDAKQDLVQVEAAMNADEKKRAKELTTELLATAQRPVDLQGEINMQAPL